MEEPREEEQTTSQERKEEFLQPNAANESASLSDSMKTSQSRPVEDPTKESEIGYTGEYGNRIEGEYQKPDSSTYRFSYKNGGGESTHSGDYYQTTEERTPKQEQGYTQAPYFGTTEGNVESRQPQTQTVHSNTQNERKSHSTFGKRLALTAVCAVVFGVVASISFIAVNSVYQKSHPSQIAETEQIPKTNEETTEQVTEGTKETGSLPQTSNNASVQSGVTDVSSIVEQTMPAVVAITSTKTGADYYDLFGQRYAGKDTTGAGTGFLVGQNDDELLIATNNHVIDGAKTISVQFIDGEICEAQKKGADASNDLAVVAVERKDVKKTTAEKIRVADLGDSEKAKVGEMVIAIGNALGYGQSVTVGYISAKDREITEESEDGSAGNKIKALQTDAAINPGNSGGALINLQGQVIGINSAKIASSSVEGVGYAIPISVATPIIDDLMKREVLKDSEKGYLGISGATVSEAATVYNVPTGVYVKAVSKGGAADLAGIKENDIITAVNQMQVTTMESLQEKVNSYRVGTKVEITFQRSSDGEYKEQTVTVTLQDHSSIDDLPSNTEQNNENGGTGNNNGGNGGYDGGFGSFWDFFQ